MISVRIAAFELECEVASSDNYPDLLTDMTSRALIAFSGAVKTMAENNIPIVDLDLIEDSQED